MTTNGVSQIAFLLPSLSHQLEGSPRSSSLGLFSLSSAVVMMPLQLGEEAVAAPQPHPTQPRPRPWDWRTTGQRESCSVGVHDERSLTSSL
jgi:hypothetical protein